MLKVRIPVAETLTLGAYVHARPNGYPTAEVRTSPYAPVFGNVPRIPRCNDQDSRGGADGDQMRREPGSAATATTRMAVMFGSMLVAFVVGCASSNAPSTSAGGRCAPPPGPGDSLVHSRDLRVKQITCSAGRKVALACARFTYGHSGLCSSSGFRWRCTSTHPPGSESTQSCAAGRRFMSIVWLD
jgi:hypothetical protein